MDVNSNINRFLDTSQLPSDIFMLRNDAFFRFIHSLVGEGLCDLLRIQLINSAEILLSTADVFDIFKYDSPQLDQLKEKYFFKLRNGQFTIKPGIASSLLYLTQLLRMKQEQQQPTTEDRQQRNRGYEFIDHHPLLKSLVSWYQHNYSVEHKKDSEHSFLSLFIDNITFNLPKSRNKFRYHDSVKRFAVGLYILGGRQAYEFVRLNLYGSLPSLVTLNSIISNNNQKIDEGKFRFDLLNQQFGSSSSNFCYLSEDCTGVIQKVKYDMRTNSFVGFSTPLNNGIPQCQFYKTDSFEELKLWFNTIEKASLINVHMVQPIPSSNEERIPIPFLLSAYGVNNTFTAVDVLQRWIFLFENFLNNQRRIIGFATGKTLQEWLLIIFRWKKSCFLSLR